MVSWIGVAAVVLSFSEPGFGTTIDKICLQQSLLLPRTEQHAFELRCVAELQRRHEREEAARAALPRHGAGEAEREHGDR